MKSTFTKVLYVSIALVTYFNSANSAHAAENYCTPLQRNIITNTILTKNETDTLVQVLKNEGIVVTTKKQDIFRGVGLLKKKYGLQIVGTVGPKTRIKMNELLTLLCKPVSVSTSTTPTIVATSTAPVVVQPVYTPDVEPPMLTVTTPNAAETFEQGYGRDMHVRWTSKNLPADTTIIVDLLNENLETVIKSWKSKNSGLFSVNYNEADDLPIGFFYIRVRYYCNSDKIPCAEDISDVRFEIYPPAGWFGNFFHFNSFNTNEKKIVSNSQSFNVTWYSYTKDFSYYRVYLGNVLLNKEEFVGNTGATGQRIQDMDVKNIKKDSKKTDVEIQNAYYIKVQAIKRNDSGAADTVVKEIVSSQFGIR